MTLNSEEQRLRQMVEFQLAGRMGSPWTPSPGEYRKCRLPECETHSPAGCGGYCRTHWDNLQSWLGPRIPREP